MQYKNGWLLGSSLPQNYPASQTQIRNIMGLQNATNNLVQ